MLFVANFYHSAECRFDECHYNECRHTECHYDECRYAECCGTTLSFVDWTGNSNVSATAGSRSVAAST